MQILWLIEIQNLRTYLTYNKHICDQKIELTIDNHRILHCQFWRCKHQLRAQHLPHLAQLSLEKHQTAVLTVFSH